MGYLGGFLVTLKQVGYGNKVTTEYSGGRVHRKRAAKGKTGTVRKDAKIPKPERLHGRHVLNRYEDGMEKCIGCELCAGVCPARCIYVRGADNDPENPTSPGERFGFVYEINYLRCIHCDMCVECLPHGGDHRDEVVRVLLHQPARRDLHQDRAARRRRGQGAAPALGDYWRDGEDAQTSGWMRATAPGGDSCVRSGVVGWSGELGYGVRRARAARRRNVMAAPHLLHARWRWTLMELFVFVCATLMVLRSVVIGVVTRSNPVHAAMSLVATLFGVAVMFVAMQAHYLAAVQVIVYAGAIVVLFLFVIMLLGVDKAEETLAVEPFPVQRYLAAITGVGLVVFLGAAIIASRDAVAARGPGLSRRNGRGARRQGLIELSRSVFGDYVVAFEVTSVLLVVAVVGTVVLARRPRERGAVAGAGEIEASEVAR